METPLLHHVAHQISIPVMDAAVKALKEELPNLNREQLETISSQIRTLVMTNLRAKSFWNSNSSQ